MLWTEMADVGKVRHRAPRPAHPSASVYLDFSPQIRSRDRYLYSDHGQRFESNVD